jgi:hypothetical protein
MALDAEYWRRSHERWLKIPRLEWVAMSKNRRYVFILKHGDPRPADPLRTPWYGPVFLEVEWQDKGEWMWLVWPGLYQGTGAACASGTEATAKAAQAAAGRAGLARLEDLMDAAIEALEKFAAPSSAEQDFIEASLAHLAPGESDED